MSKRNRTEILQGLSVVETEKLLLWFAESYEAGWRPQIHSSRDVGELHMKAVALLIELRDFHKRQEGKD